MKQQKLSLLGLVAGVLCTGALFGGGQDLQPIKLPKPQMQGGRPLMQVLQERKTTREFRAEPLPEQMLSNLLWAGFGINRPDGHRTAPSAMNSQEIDIYVATSAGLYVYEPKAHQLRPVLAGDLRPKLNSQFQQAPINLLFVADLARLTKAKPEEKDFYAGVDTGFVSQNVYLYCASEGLATVVYALGDRQRLAQALQLRPDQKPILGQAAGFPKK